MPTTFTISGDNKRILRSSDVDSGLLNWELCNPLPEKAIILELIYVHGHSHVIKTLLDNGDYAVFYSPDDCMNFDKVFTTSSLIRDITTLANNWVAMSLANGEIYESITSGSTWDLKCGDGPLIKSIASYTLTVDDAPLQLVFGHDGRYISRSIDNMETWETVCDISTYQTWFNGCAAGIKGEAGQMLATAGAGLVWNQDTQGSEWAQFPSVGILDYSKISRLHPEFRQVVHVGFDNTIDSNNWKKAHWMLAVDLRDINITRNYLNDTTKADGVFRPVTDFKINASNRLSGFNNSIAGTEDSELVMQISGRKTQKDGILKEYSQHIATNDGKTFSESNVIKLVNYQGTPVAGRMVP